MSKYAISEAWTHFFDDDQHPGQDREYVTRFVADIETNKLIYAEIQWNANGGFVRANDDEITDLEDSVVNTNEALHNADDFDIEMSDDLPEWAEGVQFSIVAPK